MPLADPFQDQNVDVSDVGELRHDLGGFQEAHAVRRYAPAAHRVPDPEPVLAVVPVQCLDAGRIRLPEAGVLFHADLDARIVVVDQRACHVRQHEQLVVQRGG